MDDTIIENHICEYGCGQEAHYQFKNGKWCCSKTSSKCPAIKAKNSATAHKHNEDWKTNGEDCRHHKQKIDKRDRSKHVDNHGKCDNPGCTNFNDGTYGSGRFCSEHCAYAYSMNIHKHDEEHHRKICEHLQKNRDLGLIQQRAQYGTWKCKECNLIFETKQQLKNHHATSHKSIIKENGKYKCIFCGKEFDTYQKVGGHLVSCPNHPNKIYHDEAHKQSGNTYKRKLCNGEYNFTNLGFVKGSHHSNKTKEKISQKRSEQVRNEYLNNFHAKVKWYKIKNIKDEEFSVRGHWEENVAKRLNELNIYWIKAKSLRYFKDYWHNYIADFYIPDLDVYIEVKGRYPNTDREKMKLVVNQNPDKKIYFIHESYEDFINGKLQFNDDLLIQQKDL